jgi:hypothetical protein
VWLAEAQLWGGKVGAPTGLESLLAEAWATGRGGYVRLEGGQAERRHCHFDRQWEYWLWAQYESLSADVWLPPPGKRERGSSLVRLAEWTSLLPDALSHHRSVLLQADPDALSGRWWDLLEDNRGMPRFELGTYREANDLFWITGASDLAGSPLREHDLRRSAVFGVMDRVYGFAAAAQLEQVSVGADFLDAFDRGRIRQAIESRLEEGWDLDAKSTETFLSRLIPDLKNFYATALARSRCLLHVSTVNSLQDEEPIVQL